MRNFLLLLATLAVMAVCGAGAFVMALSFLMNLGTKHHGNYEYYGQTPAAALIFIAGAIGFVAPGVVAWHLWKTPISQWSWRFSLRAALITMTLIALLLGVIAVAI